MEIRDRVRVGSERGFYWVWGFNSDGSVNLFGGSKDPNGNRHTRTVKSDLVTPDKRKLERKAYPVTIREDANDD